MKSLLITIMLFVSFELIAGPLTCAVKAARVGVAQTSLLADNASFADIKASYDVLRRLRGSEVDLQVDARRLINEADWAKPIPESEKWLLYGESTILDWESGARFIERIDPSQKATPELLRRLHVLSAGNLPFHGFEGRRARVLYEAGQLTEPEFKAILNRAYKQNEEVSAVPHASLRGVFRSSEYDRIVHRGSSLNNQGNRYFTKEERDAMIRNKYIAARESDFVQTGPNSYKGEVYFLGPEKISAEVDKILARTERELSQAGSPKEVVRIVEQMKVDLVSVHPFLDGNGRTIRLLEDFLLIRNGLPPGLHPNEMDLIMPVDEAVELMRRNMIHYLNEHHKRLARQ